jgi:hypothetical protein
MVLSSAMQVLLKFLWYLFSRLIIWGAAVGLVFLAFFMAMDYMDASVLTKDGMQVRAEVIIKRSDPTTLSKVFSKGFLENDGMLKSSEYLQYQVSDFDYSAETGFALIFPWQNTVTLSVTEKVTNIKAQPAPGADSSLSETPPGWENAIYNVQLVRYEDSWRIVSMELARVIPAPTPTHPAASLLETIAQ